MSVWEWGVFLRSPSFYNEEQLVFSARELLAGALSAGDMVWTASSDLLLCFSKPKFQILTCRIELGKCSPCNHLHILLCVLWFATKNFMPDTIKAEKPCMCLHIFLYWMISNPKQSSIQDLGVWASLQILPSSLLLQSPPYTPPTLQHIVILEIPWSMHTPLHYSVPTVSTRIHRILAKG